MDDAHSEQTISIPTTSVSVDGGLVGDGDESDDEPAQEAD